jgi:hypothetical protein
MLGKCIDLVYNIALFSITKLTFNLVSYCRVSRALNLRLQRSRSVHQATVHMPLSANQKRNMNKASPTEGGGFSLPSHSNIGLDVTYNYKIYR